MENEELISIPQILRSKSNVGQNLLGTRCSSDSCSIYTLCSCESDCNCLYNTCDCQSHNPCGCEEFCWCQSYCGSYIAPPAPSEKGSVSSYIAEKTSITIYYTSIANAAQYLLYFHKVGEEDPSGTYTSSLSHTFTGLTEDTNYVFNYRGVNSSGEGPIMTNSITIKTKGNRPDFFSWTSSHSPEGQSGNLVNLLASDWRALQDNINEVRIYKGGSAYSFSSRPSSGTSISHTHYNEASRAIRGVLNEGDWGNYIPGRPTSMSSSTKITDVSQMSWSSDSNVNTHEFKAGDIISADAIQALANELNSIP